MASFLEVTLKVAGPYALASLVVVALLPRHSLSWLMYCSVVALCVDVDIARSCSGRGVLTSFLLTSLGAIGIGLLASLTLLSCFAFHSRLIGGDDAALPAWMSIALGAVVVGGDDDPRNLERQAPRR